MARRTRPHQDPSRRDPPPERGPDPHPHRPQPPEGRPSLNVGPAFARTVRHFFPDFNRWLDGVPDGRRQDRVEYHQRSLLWYGVLLFAGKLGSRRQLDFHYRESGTRFLHNLNRLAQTDLRTAPHNDTLDDYLAGVGAAPIAGLRASMMRQLIRTRVLDGGRVQGRLVMGMDGSGYLVFREPHCEHCLSRKAGEQTLYCHQVLEAKILGPAQTALSLGTEFIDNQDVPAVGGEQKRKQDCELKASRRLLAEVREAFPRLQLCLSLDALYACGAGFALDADFGVSYVIVFKEGSIPTLWQEFGTLLELSPDNRLEVSEGGWRHTYRWVDELPYVDSDKRAWTLKAIEYQGFGPRGEHSRWAWLVSADLRLTETTVQEVAWGAGRVRWRQENQGFNVRKTSEMNLEHAYSEGEHFGAYYLLLQVAHILVQLLEKGSLLRTLARQAGKGTAVQLLGSLKNIARFLVESLRNWSWPQEAFDGSERIQIRLDSS